MGGGSHYLAFGIPPLSAIANAWGVGRARIVAEKELPERPFDFVVRNAGDAETRTRLLRAAIETAFGITAQLKMREVDALELVGAANDAGGLRPTELDSAGWRTARGVLEGSGMSAADLASALESALRRPVVLATELPGRYDVSLEWDPQAPAALVEALRRRTGLDLREARRKIEVLVVESH